MMRSPFLGEWMRRFRVYARVWENKLHRFRLSVQRPFPRRDHLGGIALEKLLRLSLIAARHEDTDFLGETAPCTSSICIPFEELQVVGGWIGRSFDAVETPAPVSQEKGGAS